MLDGKKSIAFKIFYDALDIVETKKKKKKKTIKNGKETKKI